MRAFLTSRPFRLVLLLSVVTVTAVSCSGEDDAGGSAVPPNSLADAGGFGRVIIDGSVKGDSGNGDAPVNPLCGAVSRCGRGNVPDDPLACEVFDAGAPPPPGPDGGAVVGVPDASQGAGEPDAGTLDGSAPFADASLPTPVLDAGIRDAAPPEASAPPLDARVAPPPGVPEEGTPRGEAFACQVRSDDDGQPYRECVRAGTGVLGAPCSSVSDCGAGLACVGEAKAGQCLPYCCEPLGHPCGGERDGGASSTFCGQRMLLEKPGVSPTLPVPVCVPADACLLSEPYPCVGAQCKCGPDSACTVVKPDGTTGCVKPGTGKIGASCLEQSGCAAGYYCSAQSQCVKICRTADLSSCSPGKCQAAAGFPDGFGICVGLAPTIQ